MKAIHKILQTVIHCSKFRTLGLDDLLLENTVNYPATAIYSSEL